MAELTHYRKNYLSLKSVLANSYGCIKLTMSLDLQPPNLTQVSLRVQLSSTNFKLHSPINELTIITALSWLLLIQNKEMEALQSEGTVSQLWVYHTPPLVPCTISAHAETTVSPEDIAGWLHPGKYWFGIFSLDY